MRRNNSSAIVIALFSLLVLAVIVASLPIIQSPPESSSEETIQPNSTENDREEPDEGPDFTLPIQEIFLIALCLGGLLALVVGYRALTQTPNNGTTATQVPPESHPDRPPDESSETQLESVAATAGTAADQIQQTDSFENEIYRAWWEMTRSLSLSSPHTKTPGEFKAAAIRAGMEEQDVHDLTQLFNSVRYGNRELTAEDERHAVTVLERIEESYQEEQS